MSKIKKQQKKTKIKNTILRTHTDKNGTPLLSFKSVCGEHYQLCEWKKEELKGLVNTFKTIENLTWGDIIRHDGLKYKPKIEHTATPLPCDFPEDASLSELRVSRKCRILGYRTGNIFNIVWFDRNHEVCPEGKVKRA